jgi:hypothetical protein
MTLSMYQASIPVFIRAFGNLSAILDKGVEHAKTAKLDPATLIEARLFEGMSPLPAQIQRASDTAKGCAARLGGIEAPKFPDEEKTFADLQARIAKTVEFLKSVKPGQIDGSEGKEISFNAGKTTLNFTGQSYLLNFALPNFFFHVTTAYDILRHKGVPVGKTDFLGRS